MLALAFALGLLWFSLIEYVHHRHAGHRKAFGKLYRGHQAHHADPMEGRVQFVKKLVQRLPLVLVGTVVLGGPWLLVLGVHYGSAAVVGTLIAYLYSEWFHHRIHQTPPKSAWASWMWRYHFVHHFRNPKVNFGFTSPLWDLVFRTYEAPATKFVVREELADRRTGDQLGFRWVARRVRSSQVATMPAQRDR